MFKVNNKNTRMASMTCWRLCQVLFENKILNLQVIHKILLFFGLFFVTARLHAVFCYDLNIPFLS